MLRQTASPEDTERLGEAWGRVLEPGDVLFLTGDLGTGKTTLVRGIARGLGVSFGVKSPTFALHLTYPGRVPVHHLDLYRIESPEHTEGLGLDDLWDGTGVVVLEWGERLPYRPALPAVSVTLRDTGEATREIAVAGDPGLVRRLEGAR